MAGLQRSTISFRRQGSSGIVWDEKLLSAELNHAQKQQQEDNGDKKPQQELNGDDPSPAVGLKIERSRSNGGRDFRAGKVSPATEPPSPRVSACGFCGGFRKNSHTRRRVPKSRKRVV